MDNVLARADARIRSDAAHQLSGPRWTIAVHGVLAVAFGAALLVWPGIGLMTLTLLFGASSLFYGSVTAGSAFSARSSRRRFWLLLLAAVDFAAGIAVIVWPSISGLALLYVIGAWAIGVGILLLAAPFWVSGAPGRELVPLMLSGIVWTVFGLVVVARPGAGALVVLSLIAAFSIAGGLLLLLAVSVGLAGSRSALSRS